MGGTFLFAVCLPLFCLITETWGPDYLLSEHECRAQRLLQGWSCCQRAQSCSEVLGRGEASSSYADSKEDSLFHLGCRIRGFQRTESLCQCTKQPMARLFPAASDPMLPYASPIPCIAISHFSANILSTCEVLKVRENVLFVYLCTAQRAWSHWVLCKGMVNECGTERRPQKFYRGVLSVSPQEHNKHGESTAWV